MSAENDDYNPVAGRGVIEKSSGLLGRRKARESFPRAEHGFELVFIDQQGEVRDNGAYATAGERYWAGPGSWLRVDIGDQQLRHRFPYQPAGGTAAYNIDITVKVRIADAPEAVRRRVSGVRVYVEPALRARLGRALPSPSFAAGGDSIARLNSARDQISQAMMAELPPGSDVYAGDWLDVTIAELSVNFTAETAAYYDQLVEAVRSAEIDTVKLSSKEKSADAEISLRKKWSEYLGPRLADPLTRAVETIAANPTQESLREIVSKLDDADQWNRQEVVAILNKLIDKDFVGDIGELKAIKMIVDTLQRSPAGSVPEIRSPSEPMKMVTDGRVIDSSAEIGSAPGDDGDIDRNWDD